VTLNKYNNNFYYPLLDALALNNPFRLTIISVLLLLS